MRALLGVLTLALTTACVPAADSASNGGDVARAPAARQADVQDPMIGAFIVTYVDGAPPLIAIEDYEPTITIGKQRIHFQSQCISADWTYERDGETIATKPSSAPGGATCERALAPGETAIQTGLSEARTIRRIRGGLYVEGGKHRLQLRRDPDKATLARRAVDLAGTWGVAGLDGQDIADPHAITLSADHEQIWWEPGCALQYRDYTIEGRRFDTRPVELSNRAVCDIAFPDELLRIWSAMDAAETIERTPSNAVRIFGNGRSLTLSSP